VKRAIVIFGWMSAIAAMGTQAATLAVVCDGIDAVTKGNCVFAPVAADGVIVPAQTALSKDLYIGIPGDPLRKGVLVRVDMDLNMGVVRGGEVVSNPDLQKAYLKRADQVQRFLPEVSNSSGATTVVQAAPTVTNGEPFLLKINGESVGSAPLVLHAKRKSAQIQLEVVRTSPIAAWHLSLELSSDPKLSFAKEGARPGIGDLPTPTLSYDRQVIFVPMGSGSSFKLPIYIYFIKQSDYVWTFKLKTGADTMEKKVSIKFQ